MDGARIVSVVKSDKDVAVSVQPKLLVDGQRAKSEGSDDAVKLSLQSKLELISDVKELQADKGPDFDDSAFAVRALTYVNKLAGKVQKLLDDGGATTDARKEQKVQELLSELARVVGYNGGAADFNDLASGTAQISGTLSSVLRRGDSAEAFADSLKGAAGFYSAALVDNVRSGAAESVSRFANNVADIRAVTGTYVRGGSSERIVSGEVFRLSTAALNEIGKSEAAASDTSQLNVVKYFQEALANQNSDVLNFDDAKKILSKLLSQIRDGVNIDDLVLGARDRVA